MANTKKILITTETHEVFRLSFNERGKAFGFCCDCNSEAEIVTLDQAVWIMRIGARELIAMADEKAIHAIETESGHFFICMNSLSNKNHSQNLMETKQ